MTMSGLLQNAKIPLYIRLDKFIFVPGRKNWRWARPEECNYTRCKIVQEPIFITFASE